MLVHRHLACTDEERASTNRLAEANNGESFVTTYPALNHLADGTEAARRFTQQLWDASRQDRYLFVSAVPGAETELVTCELSDWFGFAGLPIHQFSISQIESLEVLQAIRELPGQNQISKLVAVTDFGEATRAQIGLLQKLLSADPKLVPNGREVCWVFYLDSTRYPQLLPESSPEMFNLVKRHLITLPPLRARLADLAAYLKLHLDLFASREENPARAQLSPEAVAELLDYAWPGNYAQVVDAARAIAVTERRGPLSREDAVALLGQESATVGASLEGYLRNRQREYLEDAARHAGVATTAVIKNLKLDSAHQPKSDDLGNLGLLYPDLLSGV